MSPPAANSAASASSTSLCFHAKLPAKLAFVPYPWASSILLNALGGPYACSKTIGRADDISSVFNNIGRVGHLLLFWCFIRHQPPERPDAGSNLQNTKTNIQIFQIQQKTQVSAPTAMYQGLWCIKIQHSVEIHIESNISKHLSGRFCRRLVQYGN